MAFKVSNKGNDDGTYTFSYGKGGNKLTARIDRDGKNKFFLPAGSIGNSTSIVGQMKDLKAAFETWATANYAGQNVEKPAPVAKGPPAHKPKGPPVHAPKPKLIGKGLKAPKGDDEQAPPMVLADWQRELFATLSTHQGPLDEALRLKVLAVLRNVYWGKAQETYVQPTEESNGASEGEGTNDSDEADAS